jgi:hypothetical protein
MPTDTHNTSKAPRLSIIAVLASGVAFVVVILAMRFARPPVQIELSKIPETDRWKYSAEGRATKLLELRARENSLATTYGWMDRQAGIVRLPIERSLELTLQDLKNQKTQH